MIKLSASLSKKVPRKPNGRWPPQFRQHCTGTRAGRQKRLYVGPEWPADMVMREVWRGREAARR
jgi:hypothetical protein